jgi:hypothetical protein
MEYCLVFVNSFKTNRTVDGNCNERHPVSGDWKSIVDQAKIPTELQRLVRMNG